MLIKTAICRIAPTVFDTSNTKLHLYHNCHSREFDLLLSYIKTLLWLCAVSCDCELK